ncbi:uncharacterized protein LOC119998944 isoform X2 [Tripterygium wilfordii]|uniref:uncharacterized protein LOC119998944 isoform X2 n=1 Tax=Tripterygium wilfordii TaxID=458696 RepID=UPI0018F83823|nr:uncharacterized protein LOC119998944 isoform X2 [Tripterygium wilfordii]
MTVASSALVRTKNVMKFALSLVLPSFNSSKCKTAAKMAVARIKLLRNKREVVVRQMRRDIAMLLQSRQDATARVRVEHVIREQNVLASNEFVELFCELIVARLTIIAKQRECPADLKEGIASLIFAAPRSSEIPELASIRKIFEKKYGKDFVSAATDLRPNCGVNRILIDKLSVRTPTGEVKMKILKEIAKEYQIEWDTTECEKELLKPPEELLDGPRNFVSASRLPVKPAPVRPVEPNQSASRSYYDEQSKKTYFEDAASAAEAAEEAAKKAIAAAHAAASIAKRDYDKAPQAYGFEHNLSASSINNGFGASSTGCYHDTDYQSKAPGRVYNSWSSDRSPIISNEDARVSHTDGGRIYRRHSYNKSPLHSDVKFDESDCDEDIEEENNPSTKNEEMKAGQMDGGNPHRRHSHGAPSAKLDMKFDESDCEEEIDMGRPPHRRPPPPLLPFQGKRDLAPPGPRVHPKLPDYDDIAARFEALKYRKSRN